MTDSIILAGNPNVGKSTLFNALTGMRQHTGNWPGKTVESAYGTFKYAGQNYSITDLPGTYSFSPDSADEAVAGGYVKGHTDSAVVVVCDASALERSLILALQSMDICGRVVLCVNLLDEAMKLGKCPTKTATIVVALEQMIRSAKLARLRQMRGAIPDFSLDLDTLRGRA